MNREEYLDAKVSFDNLYLWHGYEEYGAEHARLMIVDKEKNISYFITNDKLVKVSQKELKFASIYMYKFVLKINNVFDEAFYNKKGNSDEDERVFKDTYLELKSYALDKNATAKIEDLLKLQKYYDNNYEYIKNKRYEKYYKNSNKNEEL